MGKVSASTDYSETADEQLSRVRLEALQLGLHAKGDIIYRDGHKFIVVDSDGCGTMQSVGPCPECKGGPNHGVPCPLCVD